VRERLDNDQGNQNLQEVRRKNLFRRTGRALRQMRLKSGARQFPGYCSRGRRPRPAGISDAGYSTR